MYLAVHTYSTTQDCVIRFQKIKVQHITQLARHVKNFHTPIPPPALRSPVVVDGRDIVSPPLPPTFARIEFKFLMLCRSYQ